ncbi:hypothetical protein LguiA_011231 [Lonicera macranthoides]
MADEEVVAVASPAPSDHKRKLEDLEPEEAPEPNPNPNSDSISELNSVDKPEDETLIGGDSDGSEAKRPRLEDKIDCQANVNGHQEEKVDEAKEEVAEQALAENNTLLEDADQPSVEAPDTANEEKLAPDDYRMGGIHQPSDENPHLENPPEEPSKGESNETSEEHQEPPAEAVLQQGDGSSAEQQPTSEDQPTSRKMEVPNTKVGVLIGKAGDTIRFLQYNSGARIQIVRDSDADPSAPTRPVELIGTLESINKAEKLIKDVIAEADAGGSPSLVARGFSALQSPGVNHTMNVNNNALHENLCVGSIIGKGGETIKNLQTRSGARIQLIPQHLPEGDQSKERTVRVTGDKKQIEVAREMIKEVMNQGPSSQYDTRSSDLLLKLMAYAPSSSSSTSPYPKRQSPFSSGYNQQAFRPRGPPTSQWGPRGPNPNQPTGYDYQQRGQYPSQNQQYPPRPTYGNYPPQQQAPRSNFGWDQRPPSTMQAPPPQGGYDAPPSGPPANPMHTHAIGQPPSQPNYNYAQPTPYSQTAPPAQGYGHGYNEPKYENQAPPQQSYGGQPAAYPQGTTHQGYGPQSYGVPPQGPQVQSYGQPRANQPGDMPYQGPVSHTQSYGPNATPQQPYPYASSGPMQQSYPPYGSAPAADGYSHPPPAAAPASVYPQQTSQPVAGYGQPGGQQAPGYAPGPTGNYGLYPTSQPGYTEQAAPNNPGYGYQGPADPAYGSAPVAYGAPQPTGQQLVYSQPAPTQPGYDQSVPQTAGYGSVPVGYKSLSPQPGYPHYDPNQMYAGQR